MPTWGWLLTAVAGAVIVWVIPRLLTFFAAALADALIDRVADKLQPLWSADLEDSLERAVEPMRAQVAAIKSEVTLNGGGSMKDRVLEIQRRLEALPY